MGTVQTGLAGEFYVLAQLAHRGYIGTLTLGNTKNVDIVVFNPATKRYWRLEVKTTREAAKNEKLFSNEKLFIWQLTQKHEAISEPDLVYCFVALSSPDVQPKFFLVPSATVAKYAAWEHKHWLKAPHKRAVKDTEQRKFRIEMSDPKGFASNWAILDGT
ncbi:MAG: hypothetical protein JSS26_19755 [Nitrospira sp.]|nr:hypothetical protein [Nitrospira sp.]